MTTGDDVRAATRRLSKFLKDEDAFMEPATVDAAVKRMGFESTSAMAEQDPVAFLEFVDTICIGMEDDPDYSGNPETGRAWE